MKASLLQIKKPVFLFLAGGAFVLKFMKSSEISKAIIIYIGILTCIIVCFRLWYISEKNSAQTSYQPVVNDEINLKYKAIFETTDNILSLSILPWVFSLVISGFLFDSPGSEKNLTIITIAITIWLYGPLYFISRKWAEKHMRVGDYKKAFQIALLPVYDIGICVISFASWA